MITITLIETGKARLKAAQQTGRDNRAAAPCCKTPRISGDPRRLPVHHGRVSKTMLP